MARNPNPRPPESAAAEPAALPDFTPIVLRHRYDGWTPERQRLYVAALAECGNGGVAARRVGMTPQSLVRLFRRPGAESFARACELAYAIERRRRRALARQRVGPPRGPRNFLPQGSRTL